MKTKTEDWLIYFSYNIVLSPFFFFFSVVSGPLSPMDKVVTASVLAQKSPRDDTRRAANFMLPKDFRLLLFTYCTPPSDTTMRSGG